MMALNTDVEHKSNLVVRIDQNSDSDLQALFDSVLKPDSKRPLQVPLRMRKLPDSFFTPPSTGSKSPSVSHSRDNSSDSTPGLTVSHPRAHSSPASLQQTYASAQQQVQHLKQRSYDVGLSAVEDIGPLPPGWEQARTPEGQVYYLNHITRTTTWEDPRKTLAAQVAQSQQQAAEQLIASGASSTATAQTGKSGEGTLGTLPDGWEQAATPEGEVYFINHQTRTTSWFDPRIPVHLQRSPAGALLPQHSGSWLQPLSSQTLQACQQKLRLQSLQMERERLKLRQQEIMRQAKCGPDLMLRGQPNTELDPFLSSLTEHSRQESADSGLGLGNGYSLPHTPEDFLANMDDNMDGVSEGGNPSEMALDSTDMDNIDSTDDLVPSLQVSSKQLPWARRWQELGEEFSNDILDDVQSLINPTSIKPDNVLTWL